MSVRKLRNSWWVDFRCEGLRYRKKSPDNSRAGAAAYEALLRQRLARGESMASARARCAQMPTFRAFAQDWLETTVRANNKPSTIRYKVHMLQANLLPAFGDLRLNEITTQRIERYKATRAAQDRAPQTINNDLAVLRGCLRAAVDWLLLPVLPQVRWLRAPSGPVRFLSPAEVQRLVAAADKPLWRNMIIVALHTGLRFGELTALDWSDVDLAARRLSVRRNLVNGILGTPKNHRERHIPLTETVCGTLASHAHTQGFVFCRPDGRPVDHHTATSALHRTCDQAGIAQLGWHKLRHTFASHLVARGVPLPAVQQLLGHATITMTMRYAHLAPDALVQAVAVLDREPVREKLGHPVGNAVPTPPPVPAVASTR